MSTSLRKRVFCLYPNAEVQKPLEHDEETWYINVKSLQDIRDKDAFYITNLLSGWKLTDENFAEAIMYKVNITDGFTNENEEKAAKRKIQKEKEKKESLKNQLTESLQEEFEKRQEDFHMGVYEKLPEAESLDILKALLEKEYTIRNFYYDDENSVIRDRGKRRIGWIKAESLGKNAGYLQDLYLQEKQPGIAELGYSFGFDERGKIVLFEP